MGIIHAPACCSLGLEGLGRARLFLFLSLGSSLADWRAGGTLERETAIYRALLSHLAGVSMVSYGKHDRALAPDLGGLKVLDNRLGLPGRLYRLLLQSGRTIGHQGPAVVKTNQMQGADLALAAARRAGHAFVARCGYLPSNIAIWRAGEDSPEAQRWYSLETRVLNAADCCVVTTPAMAGTLAHRYGVPPQRIRVIPNYVDTDLFTPHGPEQRRSDLVLYVGRLHQEKNLEPLLLAMRGLDAELHLVGEGPQRPALEALVIEHGLPVRFLGRVANPDLPALMRQATVCVLPSKGEHHPKALIEAMACGAAVLGSDAPGIREIIAHEQSGLLCGLEAEHIHEGLSRLLGDADLRARLGEVARRQMQADYSFSRVLDLELAMLSELVG
ncbi:MAG: glycosyltransferase family 4 protein [Pseudomonadota bacterium]